MHASAVTPRPWFEAAVGVDEWSTTRGNVYAALSTEFGTFTQSAALAGNLCELLLMGLEQKAAEEVSQNRRPASQIVRVEFILQHDGWAQRRGAVFIDSSGRRVMHVLHALLGNGGAGSALSRQLLYRLGVSAEMIDEANEEVTGLHYHVIFSREVTDAEGVPYVLQPSRAEGWRYRRHAF